MEFAVTKDRDLVGDGLDFSEPMADVDDGDAVLFPLLNFSKEDLRLWDTEGSGRFVED
ncbi:MAG: hypothetical protein ACK5FS_00195 [Planctomycetota bacterium]